MRASMILKEKYKSDFDIFAKCDTMLINRVEFLLHTETRLYGNTQW